jgi:hypothetical protein
MRRQLIIASPMLAWAVFLLAWHYLSPQPFVSVYLWSGLVVVGCATLALSRSFPKRQ